MDNGNFFCISCNCSPVLPLGSWLILMLWSSMCSQSHFLISLFLLQECFLHILSDQQPGCCFCQIQIIEYHQICTLDLLWLCTDYNVLLAYLSFFFRWPFYYTGWGVLYFFVGQQIVNTSLELFTITIPGTVCLFKVIFCIGQYFEKSLIINWFNHVILFSVIK